MTLESNIVNEIKFLQFNDEKAMNAISADDWIKLQEEIDSFENSDQKYLVIKHINGNYSAGAQLEKQLMLLWMMFLKHLKNVELQKTNNFSC